MMTSEFKFSMNDFESWEDYLKSLKGFLQTTHVPSVQSSNVECVAPVAEKSPVKPKKIYPTFNSPKASSSLPKPLFHGSLIIDIAGTGRKRFKLISNITIGRAEENQVVRLGDDLISRTHACLYLKNGVVMVRDLGSANGTFLNGSKILNPEPVADGDCLRIGNTEIRIYF